MTIYADSQRPLDVGGITADALSIYFQRFGLMFTLSLIPAILAVLITGAAPRVSSFQAASDPGSRMAALLPDRSASFWHRPCRTP